MANLINVRQAWALGAVVLTVLYFLWAPAAGASAKVASHELGQSPQEVRDYWTPERMKNAIPLDGPEAPKGATTAADASPRAAPPDVETSPGLDTLYPQRVNGKLFLTSGNINGSCSATVVTSLARNLILTAGHCVVMPSVGGPIWSNNVMFVPSYRNMARPFGTYVATRSSAPGIWVREGDITFDVGAINLAPGPGGLIQDALGSRGVTFNKPYRSYRGQSVQIFGYPGEPEVFGYDAERLIVCNSPLLGVERFTGALVASPCHQQEGSSGGAWLLSNGLLNSVVSHGACNVVTPACTAMSGTYFGDFIFDTYARAGGVSKGVKKKIKGCNRIERQSKRQRCLNRAETIQPILR